MRSLGSTGVWELFVPDVGAGTRYKFEILGSDGVAADQGRPAWPAATEEPPPTASVVTVLDVQVGRRRLDAAPRGHQPAHRRR